MHNCNPPIVHGDLSCDTIFIQHNGLIKIGSIAPDIVNTHVKTCIDFSKWSRHMHFIAPEIKDPSLLVNELNENTNNTYNTETTTPNTTTTTTTTTTSTENSEQQPTQQQQHSQTNSTQSTAIDMYAFGMVALEVGSKNTY